MFIYKFFDNINGIDYDIKGEDYRQLISRCFLYSENFSLAYRFKAKDITELAPYLVKSGYSTEWPGYCIGSTGATLKIYRSNDKSCNIFMRCTNRIFSWAPSSVLPEDPAFYRKDGSLFFFSCINEGMCYLLPRRNEEISDIVEKPGWEIVDIEKEDEDQQKYLINFVAKF